MKKRKITGYIIMLLGILFPLYAFVNLSLNELYSEKDHSLFIQEGKKISEENRNKILKSIERYEESLGENSGEYVDPFTNSEYNGDYKGFKNMNTDIFSYVSIPKLNLKKPMRLGASQYNLAKGLAHIDGTDLPVGGIGNRSVIAGHRGYYKDKFFLYLNKLEAGDKVVLEDITGNKLTYIVRDKEIINPNQWERLLPVEEEDILTLLTCDPMIPPSPNRLLVNCVRVENDNIFSNKKAKTNKNKIIITEDKYEKKYRTNNVFIYLITILLLFLFSFTFVKFIKYIKEKQ